MFYYTIFAADLANFCPLYLRCPCSTTPSFCFAYHPFTAAQERGPANFDRIRSTLAGNLDKQDLSTTTLPPRFFMNLRAAIPKRWLNGPRFRCNEPLGILNRSIDIPVVSVPVLFCFVEMHSGVPCSRQFAPRGQHWLRALYPETSSGASLLDPNIYYAEPSIILNTSHFVV